VSSVRLQLVVAKEVILKLDRVQEVEATIT
jgi:hypothetical protein